MHFWTSLGASLLIGAVSCTGGTGRSQGPAEPEPGRPPQRLSANWFICPPGFDFLARADRYYPPSHPAVQQMRERPDRCYFTAAQAQRAGYALAPPPPGDAVVGGVYLEPTGQQLRAQCESVVSRSRLPVPCPRLLPVGLGSRPYSAPGYFVLEWSFSGPPGYVGIDGNPGNHAFIQAYGPRFVKGNPCVTPASSPRGPPIRGVRTRFMDCPEGSSMNSGHSVLVWRTDGIIYAVSVHGHTEVNRRIDLVIARHLDFVKG